MTATNGGTRWLPVTAYLTTFALGMLATLLPMLIIVSGKTDRAEVIAIVESSSPYTRDRQFVVEQLESLEEEIVGLHGEHAALRELVASLQAAVAALQNSYPRGEEVTP